MLIIFVNLAFAMLLIAFIDERWAIPNEQAILSVPLAKRWAFSALAVLVIWTSISIVQYSKPLTTPTVKAAAIQPAVSPIIIANQNRADQASDVRSRMVEQSQEAAEKGAQVIVWPEGALLWDPQVDLSQIDFSALAKETNAYLTIGYVVNMENGFRNEATVINPQGEFLGSLEKTTR